MQSEFELHPMFCDFQWKTSRLCRNLSFILCFVIFSGRLHDFVETSTQFGCRAFGPLRIICEKVVLGVTDKVSFCIIGASACSAHAEIL